MNINVNVNVNVNVRNRMVGVVTNHSIVLLKYAIKNVKALPSKK